MRADSALCLIRTRSPLDHQVPRVGVLVPWANQTVEAELPQLCRGTVICHYARLVPHSRGTRLDDGFLGGLWVAVPSALGQLERLPLNGVLLACTSAGFTTSSGAARVTTAFDALVESLQVIHANQVVLATPYPQALTDREADAFASQGIGVLASVALGRDDDFADVTADEIRRLVRDLPPDALAAADALVLSCTAWPTLDLLADLEAEVGVRVLSSNIAMAIHASRLTPARVPV